MRNVEQVEVTAGSSLPREFISERCSAQEPASQLLQLLEGACVSQGIRIPAPSSLLDQGAAFCIRQHLHPCPRICTARHLCAQVSFRSYWTKVLLEQLRSIKGDIAIKEISDATMIRGQDIVDTLQVHDEPMSVNSGHRVVKRANL